MVAAHLKVEVGRAHITPYTQLGSSSRGQQQQQLSAMPAGTMRQDHVQCQLLLAALLSRLPQARHSMGFQSNKFQQHDYTYLIMHEVPMQHKPHILPMCPEHCS
jgi:hypothetical protein